jgi:shikimate dehydrogenase
MDRLVSDVRKLEGTGTTITWTHWGDGVFMEFFPSADLFINCTPVGTMAGSNGTSPIEPAWLPRKGIVFDLVYNPPETPLLKAAKAQGLQAVSGMGMLVYQAAESFKIWTGKDADVAAMRAAGEKALGS